MESSFLIRPPFLDEDKLNPIIFPIYAKGVIFADPFRDDIFAEPFRDDIIAEQLQRETYSLNSHNGPSGI